MEAQHASRQGCGVCAVPWLHSFRCCVCRPAGYPPGSLLYGRELPGSQRVATEWGSHSLVDAAEALLAAALRNPRNTKFFMLSESDLPLYSPETLYLQVRWGRGGGGGAGGVRTRGGGQGVNWKDCPGGRHACGDAGASRMCMPPAVRTSKRCS
jgi:hypothetical protein